KRLQRRVRRAVGRHRRECRAGTRRRLRPPRGRADREPAPGEPAPRLSRRRTHHHPQPPGRRSGGAMRVPTGPIAALVAMVLIWGYSWVVMKIALRHAHPFDYAALRVGTGCVLLFAIVKLRGRSLLLGSYRMALLL